jgi:hypothetical protein
MGESRGWLPDEVAIIPAGPQLALVLAHTDRASLSDEDLVRLAQARQRLAAHLQAQLLADLYAIGQRSDEILAKDEEGRRHWAECEVAMAMTWTGRAASWQLGLAEDLLERLPAVFAALDAGEIDVPRANVFCAETTGLDVEVARRVADQLLGEAHTLTTGQLRVRLRKLVIAADPQVTARNAKEQVKGRRVVAQLTCDGLAELAGYDLPPHRVAAAMERLTAIGRAAKAAGDSRRLDQLRADALLDLLVGEGVAVGAPVSGAMIGAGQPEPGPSSPAPAAAAAFRRLVDQPDDDGDDSVDPDHEELAPLWDAGFDQLPTQRPTPAGCCVSCGGPKGPMPGPRKGVIDLQVPLTTLLGLTDFPGELAGFGPVIADIARQVVAEEQGAAWRFSVYDPVGDLTHHGITRRRPKAEDLAFIRARDRTCRAPGCRRPARQCDVDHTDDWARSHDSRQCNLACYCRLHHRFKHLKQSRLIQITPGTMGLKTPLGQHLVTHPEPYVDELAFTLLLKLGIPLRT